MFFHLFRTFSLLLAVFLGLSPAAFAESEHPDFFPLEKGTYWIYRGESKFRAPKKNATKEEIQKGVANETTSEVLTWKMEVVDTLERPNLFAARIKGGPWDLAWYEPGKPRGDYVILRVGDLRYYQYEGGEAQKLWKQLQASDPQRAPSDIKEGELILDCPLAPGKVFGGEFWAYLGSHYCWVVDGETPLKAQRFPGAEKYPHSTEYALSFHTNLTHTTLHFATGVGITTYAYSHRIAETELGLIEFGKAQPGGKEQTGAEKNKKPVHVEIVPGKDGGNVRVTYADGTSDFWTQKGHCTEARLAPDGTVGWTVTESMARPQGPGPLDRQKLVLCRKGRIVASLESGNPQITAWNFTPKGDQVVMKTDTAHGPHGRIELFDIASGKCLESVAESAENLPAWVRAMDGL